MVKSWSNHGQVMVNFDHGLTMVNHGQPWSFTMNDHDHMTMVDYGQTMGSISQTWLTMV